jgi:hypothetical protein
VAAITAQVIEDDPSPNCSTAQVRVVHFSADAPAVDIATSGAAPEDAVIQDLAYPDASGYLDLPGDTYDLEVRLAGETTVALPLPGVTIEDCTSYSVFAVGSAASPAIGDNALQVVVAVDGTASPSEAEPEASLPPTDTLPGAAAAGTDAGSGPVLALVAAIAFIAGLAALARRTRPDLEPKA